MPVPAQPRVNRHTGNGVTDTWAYGFRILNKLDIGVDVDGALLTVDVDYTVTDVGEANGGTIVFAVPPANLAKITLYSNAAYARIRFDYVRNGSFKEETVDADFDQLTILIQQIDERFGRGLSIPITDATGTSVELPSETERAGMILGFDSAGNVVALAPADLDITMVSAFIATLLDDPDEAMARDTLGAFAKDGSDVLTGDLQIGAGKKIIFEGTTEDNFETTVAPSNPTADRIITLQDKSGTLAFTSDINGGRRQCVQSASVDASGYANFMSGVDTTTLTIAASAGTPFVANAAYGDTSRTGRATANLTLGGQNVNGTYYDYVDVAVDGTLTLGSTSSAPAYQNGGAPSNTLNQFTYNKGERKSYVGSGAAAPQASRVYIGEHVVAGNVISTVTPYALNGRYSSGRFAIASNTNYSKAHNLGVDPASVLCLGATSVGGQLAEFWKAYYYNGSSNEVRFGALNSITKTGCVFSSGQSGPWLMTSATGVTVAVEALIEIDRGWE